MKLEDNLSLQGAPESKRDGGRRCKHEEANWDTVRNSRKKSWLYQERLGFRTVKSTEAEEAPPRKTSRKVIQGKAEQQIMRTRIKRRGGRIMGRTAQKKSTVTGGSISKMHPQETNRTSAPVIEAPHGGGFTKRNPLAGREKTVSLSQRPEEPA